VANLLHIDSSIHLDGAVNRALTERAARGWRDAHLGGTVTYRGLGAEPIPHLDTAGGLARHVPPIETIVLGLPLYNLGAPRSLKAWADHLIAPGLSIDADSHEGLTL
jgi:FMN-dependent NADH-azoreductase